MTIIYPINGRNERLGELFKTPKHNLLYKGTPAIKASVEYLSRRFPFANHLILLNERYKKTMLDMSFLCRIVPDTDSQVETLRIGVEPIEGPVMFVDCDIVPESLNDPLGNTVYLFENKEWLLHYSNYSLIDGEVVDCNEKGQFYPWAGAGIYYFEDSREFMEKSEGCKSISEVVKKCKFRGDTTSRVFRFGTLNDIKNDEGLINRIY